MMTLGWLIFAAGAAIGIRGTQAWYAGTNAMLKATHKKEMDEIFEEVQRARAQVADLIGKDDE
jgi:hypothetical protein